MTRPSKRELERALEEVKEQQDPEADTEPYEPEEISDETREVLDALTTYDSDEMYGEMPEGEKKFFEYLQEIECESQ